jgi:hypothetical protein
MWELFPYWSYRLFLRDDFIFRSRHPSAKLLFNSPPIIIICRFTHTPLVHDFIIWLVAVLGPLLAFAHIEYAFIHMTIVSVLFRPTRFRIFQLFRDGGSLLKQSSASLLFEGRISVCIIPFPMCAFAAFLCGKLAVGRNVACFVIVFSVPAPGDASTCDCCSCGFPALPLLVHCLSRRPG